MIVPVRARVTVPMPESSTDGRRPRTLEDVAGSGRATRRTNLALLVLLATAFATGWVAFGIGTPAPSRAVAVIHGACGLGLLLLVPWKSAIVRRAWRRRVGGAGGSAHRGVSVAFAVLVAVSVVAGVWHALGGDRAPGGLTPMQLHVGAALLAVPLLVLHAHRHRQRVRRTDLSRRAALKALAVGGGAVASYAAVEGSAIALGLPGAGRRETGSHQVGSGDPEAMPVTQWTLDPVPAVDVATWRLVVVRPGAVRELAYGDLLAAATDTVRAVLDCTGGWYAEQEWRGVRLDRLIGDAFGDLGGVGGGGATAGDPPARSVLVGSVTGYTRRLPLRDATALLLATHVGGTPLSAGHGAPLRLVVPGRRGFWWVKWVSRVEVSAVPWWWQPPFPFH